MNKILPVILIGSLIVSCQVGTSDPTQPTTTAEVAAPESTPVNVLSDDKVVESYSDSSTIGRPNRNKIELNIIERPTRDTSFKPSNLAVIKFYSQSRSLEWNLKQTLEVESEALMDANPEIEDFDNDGLKDITFVSNTAARGANEMRTLLIYDKVNDALIRVKNSEEFPNLAYNRTLKCIDSWMFHGATTTVFLRLEGDMLKEFASVDTGSELVVTVYDKQGHRREVRREKMQLDDIYTRYETFSPPRPYGLVHRRISVPRNF